MLALLPTANLKAYQRRFFEDGSQSDAAPRPRDREAH
jgi:hypothetical protein